MSERPCRTPEENDARAIGGSLTSIGGAVDLQRDTFGAVESESSPERRTRESYRPSAIGFSSIEGR
jgi:hypothetical protein